MLENLYPWSVLMALSNERFISTIDYPMWSQSGDILILNQMQHGWIFLLNKIIRNKDLTKLLVASDKLSPEIKSKIEDKYRRISKLKQEGKHLKKRLQLLRLQQQRLRLQQLLQ